MYTNKESLNINKPFISVVMNCYNSEKYLNEAIESVVSQTYDNFEIIFWDNQSTDRSAEIVRNWKDSRIKYYYAPKHTALGEARNYAISKAQGEWIAFIDCDDLWVREKLALQVSLIQQHRNDLGLVYGRIEYLVESEGRTTILGKKPLAKFMSRHLRLPQGRAFAAMMVSNYVPLVTAMLNRKLFYELGGINPQLKQAEDYEIFTKFAYSYTVAAVDAVICLYRIHQNNLSHNQSELSYTESISIVEKYLPDPSAIAGLAVWRAKYAGYLFRKGRIRNAVAQLIQSGNYRYFFIRCIFKILMEMLDLSIKGFYNLKKIINIIIK
jgi:glycosyltransferase involved in cell wall biosynthesis